MCNISEKNGGHSSKSKTKHQNKTLFFQTSTISIVWYSRHYLFQPLNSPCVSCPGTDCKYLHYLLISLSHSIPGTIWPYPVRDVPIVESGHISAVDEERYLIVLAGVTYYPPCYLFRQVNKLGWTEMFWSFGLWTMAIRDLRCLGDLVDLHTAVSCQ